MSDLPRDLRVKAGMIMMCERIPFGSDAALMELAANEIEQLQQRNAELEAMLVEVNNNRTGVSPCARFCEALAAKKMFDNLQRERDELAAQVEKLRVAATIVLNARDEDGITTSGLLKKFNELSEALSFLPHEYLAERDREVAARAVEVAANELSRKLFEKQVKNKGWSTDFISLNGQFHAYSDPDIDNMWLGWSAAIKGLLIKANKIKSGEVEL